MAGGAFSEDEVNLYDRQIRLWGADAQARIRRASVLLVRARELAQEAGKNLVLAGIGRLTLLDGERVCSAGADAHLCIGPSDAGKTYAEAVSGALGRLNPSAQVVADSADVGGLADEYLSSFDVVVGCELDLDSTVLLNAACRRGGVAFYSCAVYGPYGYVFADLIEHTYSRAAQAARVGGREGERVEATERYCPLSEMVCHRFGDTLTQRHKQRVSPLLPGIMGLWRFQQRLGRFPDGPGETAQYLALAEEASAQLGLPRDILERSVLVNLAEKAGCRWPPVASVVGGVLAQDILNVLSRQERPIQNLFLFDGETCSASSAPAY